MHAKRPCSELGVLGGTFNPPHRGHVELAMAAADQLGLERVLLIPARVAPHKQDARDPGAEHRLAMCRMVAGGDPRLEVSTLELDRPAPSFTIDTLRSLRHTVPDARLTLIMGADTACTLPCWREPLEILGLARLAVAERDSQRRESVIEALAPLRAPQPLFVDMPPVEISSSAVRDRIAIGEPVQALVGPEVARYIAEHALYTTPSSGIDEDGAP